ncbi:hypothetical protein SDRG_02318 [Saprolegnia diclina VS20]|uniref:Uncharacterized protein n=1 Tax=Saprolegnia diclina (strain VS20) TaxID=1156394 RepID=T0SC81_SAPDV|nr:hypothetical protein SDRG_02318 [Saprolegnia diclina VS20]EQC40422.1 hypothetical protein SDRG_02318 [Saprolegnia diclina VS20]|eukprot:XP_008606121.1 hypothetical protein SDRG_02318 [Saprolegnia diclina VS20]
MMVTLSIKELIPSAVKFRPDGNAVSIAILGRMGIMSLSLLPAKACQLCSFHRDPAKAGSTVCKAWLLLGLLVDQPWTSALTKVVWLIVTTSE